MDVLTERQKKIMEKARATGKVEVDKLALRFSVSPQTIRKDLNELCDRLLLQRIHGGAIVGSGVENVSYEARRLLAPEAKLAIGLHTAHLIPNHCSLIINIGTTTEQVAHALRSHVGLMVISNNINTIDILRNSTGTELIISGGLVRRSDGGIIGDAAVEFINQFKADYAVIGVSAIDEDGSLLDYDLREVRVAKAIIANARHVILVADQMKLSRTATVRLGHVADVNTIVTDEPFPDNLQKICQEHGVLVEIASL